MECWLSIARPPEGNSHDTRLHSAVSHQPRAHRAAVRAHRLLESTRDAKEQQKHLQRVKRRRVQLHMEAINLRVEAAISAMVSNNRLDEPLQLMGVTVDMHLTIQIASLAATGLASGVFECLSVCK